MYHKGIVMEIKDKYCLIMNEDGDIIRIHKKGNMHVGDQIYYLLEDVYKEQEENSHSFLYSKSFHKTVLLGIAVVLIFVVTQFTSVLKPVDAYATVFIFDDLERANISSNELFGIINNLVEHKNAKCIFVGNEEIMKKDNFKKIKEKIISRTLYYETDIESFLNSIEDKVTKKMDKDEWEIFKRVVLNENNKNLRTILCTLPLIIKLYKILKIAIGDNQEVSNKVLYNMFDDIYRVEIWYKEGHDRLEYSEPDRYYMQICFDDHDNHTEQETTDKCHQSCYIKLYCLLLDCPQLLFLKFYKVL